MDAARIELRQETDSYDELVQLVGKHAEIVMRKLRWASSCQTTMRLQARKKGSLHTTWSYCHIDAAVTRLDVLESLNELYSQQRVVNTLLHSNTSLPSSAHFLAQVWCPLGLLT